MRVAVAGAVGQDKSFVLFLGDVEKRGDGELVINSISTLLVHHFFSLFFCPCLLLASITIILVISYLPTSCSRSLHGVIDRLSQSINRSMYPCSYHAEEKYVKLPHFGA